MAIIIEAKDAKANPKFSDVEDQVRRDAMQLAKKQWGLDYGGMFPGENEYGETPIRLCYLNLGTTSGTAETWNRTLSNTGWVPLINGKKVIDDVILGITGWEIASSTKRIAAIYQKYGERTFPVINFETEIQQYEQPQILFEKGVVVNKLTNVDVDVLCTVVGNQVIKPLGFALVKKYLMIQKKPV